MSTSWISSNALLLGLVMAVLGQQALIYFMRRREAQREELFRIITENAADMIALVDLKGRRQYNSPAYQRVLGYTAAELAATPVFEQIHPDDRFKVLEAARSARETGVGKRLQYRLRHKNGTWRVLESTASAIKNAKGEVEKLVIVNRDITERKQAEDELEQSVLHDPLTGLPNRRLYLDRLQRAFARERRDPKYRYAILLIAVDDLPSWEESASPHVQDEIIAALGQRIESELRLDDTIAHSAAAEDAASTMLSRFEAAEFTILLENTQNPSDAMRVAHRVQAVIAKPIPLQDRQIVVGSSIGIAFSTSPHDKADDLLRDAAVAMRRAQARGDGRCELYDEILHTRAVHRLSLENELARALERSEFSLHYQPILVLVSRQLAGFEALLRWEHPQKGVISPYHFIDVAEDTGLIAQIDEWVIHQVCRQLGAWQSTYPSARQIRVSVNISGRQLSNPNLTQSFRNASKQSGIALDRLQIEIAEHVAMSDPKLTSNVLLQFKQLGVGRILDDFGGGPLSLSWLRKMPLSGLKIDRSIINCMGVDHGERELLRLIAAVARQLSLNLSAEGIEAISQIDPLIEAGCECGQGYLFCRPVEASQAEKFFADPSKVQKSSPTLISKS